MSQDNSLVSNPGRNESQRSPEETTFYCSECLEKILNWSLFKGKFMTLHQDIHELVDCGNRCGLCGYICNLFGKSHLEDYIARAVEYNKKPVEIVGPDAANIFVNHNGYTRTLLSVSQDPKIPPTVGIHCYAPFSRSHTNGRLDYGVLSINLRHHVTTYDDSRTSVLYSEAGIFPMPLAMERS